MIDKRVGMSKKLGKISDKASRLYFMVYPHLDKKGRIAFDDLGDLKIEIIPWLKTWDLKKIGDSLNELADIGLIRMYLDKDKIAMEFDKFNDFQTINDKREAVSKIVAPGETQESSGVFQITPLLSLSLKKSNEGRKEEKIFFDFDEQSFENISNKDKERWKKTYPSCDIEQEILKMADWLVANPSKRKSNYKKFISNWLSRQQDGGGTKKGKESSGAQGMLDKLRKESNVNNQ